MTTRTKIAALITLLNTGCGGGDFFSKGSPVNYQDASNQASTGGDTGQSPDSSDVVKKLTESGIGGNPNGGSGGSGGTSSIDVIGGSPSSGGSPASGGTSSEAGGSGGIHSTGGQTTSGGTTSVGGSLSGGVPGTGGSPCVPKICPNDGVTCGQINDGCGHKAQCSHQCVSGQTCGANNPNQCGTTVCVEWTQSEMNSMCAGKCGYIVSKCGVPIIHDCSALNGAICQGPYSFCDGPPYPANPINGTNGTGVCTGLQPSNGDQCIVGSSQPFPYHGDYLTASDGIQDDGESDVDCGGPHNPRRCAIGKSCTANQDCASQACSSGKCANSNARLQGCEWPPGTTQSDFNGDWCCTDSTNGCYRSQMLDNQCNSITAGLWGFTCPLGSQPPTDVCTNLDPALGSHSTQFCCSKRF